jgi:hypothetical protein
MVRWVSPEVMLFSCGFYTRVKNGLKLVAWFCLCHCFLKLETNLSVADSVPVIRYGIKIINPNPLGPLEVANL